MNKKILLLIIPLVLLFSGCSAGSGISGSYINEVNKTVLEFHKDGKVVNIDHGTRFPGRYTVQEGKYVLKGLPILGGLVCTKLKDALECVVGGTGTVRYLKK